MSSPTKTAKGKPKTGAAYGQHKAGSRKGRVHEAYDRQGFEAAFGLGKKLGLAEATIRAWCSYWRREAEKGQPAKVKTARPKVGVKKAETKPAAEAA